ncbi:MAG: hypothetical protein R3E32_06005 [Chitinophagales bacterium]
MQYKTNQLDKIILFSSENYKNITKDFWVYKFKIDAKKVGYQYSLIDEVKQELNGVKSVVYLASKAFYALFEKTKFKNEFELEEKIQNLIKNSDEVQFSQITNLRDKNEIDTRHLAQLLFNSLANTATKNTKYSNITGGLYWVVKTNEAKQKKDSPKITWQYITLKLELDYHLHLRLHVKTFSNLKMTGKMNFTNRKTKLKDYVQYEILSDNIRSMRRLKSTEYNKKPNSTYILAQIDGKKSNIPFLDFSNWEKFEVSKSGVLYLFLKEVKEHLNEYINVNFVQLPFNAEKTEFDKTLSNKVKTRIQEFCHSIPIVINIADSLKNDKEAQELAQNLQVFLTNTNYNIGNICIGNLSKKSINIRIIRNKQYYKNNNLTDEYCKNKNYLIHHITTDDFEKKNKTTRKRTIEKAAVDVIFKESYIKNDIRNGKITIIDWTFGEWLFMGKEEVKEENQDKKDKKFNYHLLKVSTDGRLTYKTCLYNEVFSNSAYERYKAIYQQYDKFNGREFLNCLLVSNHQDINLIFETPLFTIQEIEKIGETLELENQDTEISKSAILRMFEKFIQKNELFAKDERFDKIISKTKSYKEKFTKHDLNTLFYDVKKIKHLEKDLKEAKKNGLQSEIKNLEERIQKFKSESLSNQTKIKKEFCRFYYENSYSYLGKKDVLHHFFKGKEDMDELFASSTNIYFQSENLMEAFYFVGIVPEQLQTSFQNATNIRKIKAVRNLKGKQSQLVFDQLLETMAVDFVKQGNLTVLPFPFKYLRELKK